MASQQQTSKYDVFVTDDRRVLAAFVCPVPLHDTPRAVLFSDCVLTVYRGADQAVSLRDLPPHAVAALRNARQVGVIEFANENMASEDDVANSYYVDVRVMDAASSG